MSNVKVTVIIPTYNRVDYLKKTLDSIVAQTFQDFEIIVVDDGSPNDTTEVLCKHYSKVKYIRIPNSGGPAKPRNTAIKEANGDYIAFVDDDDIWLPTKLEKQVKALEENPDFGLAHCFCNVIDGDGNTTGEVVGKPGNASVKHGDVSLRMMGNWTIMMPTPLVNKKVVQKTGFFNEEIPGTFADVEYWVRASFETKFYYLNEGLVNYRVHEQNMSNDKQKYMDLPLYLKIVLEELLQKKKINKQEYYSLRNSLCKMQIGNCKTNWRVSLSNCFKLDFLWMFKKNNLKMFLYLIFIKK
jgi:glycosyltransferase involved in cell wall biosynthesis